MRKLSDFERMSGIADTPVVPTNTAATVDNVLNTETELKTQNKYLYPQTRWTFVHSNTPGNLTPQRVQAFTETDDDAMAIAWLKDSQLLPPVNLEWWQAGVFGVGLLIAGYLLAKYVVK